MSLDDRVRVIMMNLVSRVVGATVRGGTIVVGLGAIFATIVATILALIGFIALPAIALYLIVISMNYSSY